MDKIIYKREAGSTEDPRSPGILIQEWKPLSEPKAILTIVVTGRNVAGIILDRDEVEELTKNLISWIGDTDSEHKHAEESGDAVHAGPNISVGSGRTA